MTIKQFMFGTGCEVEIRLGNSGFEFIVFEGYNKRQKVKCTLRSSDLGLNNNASNK